MNRPNLKVITNAQVTGIVFDGKRATGLQFRRDGREEAVEASREVILCGGTFGSLRLD
jgi:choline dehydrogenase-like flavoprotein